MSDALERLIALDGVSPVDKLHSALREALDLARFEPHMHALMYTRPDGEHDDLIAAAGRSQDLFLGLVEDVVGADNARSVGALLLTSAHGIAGMDIAGHLDGAKWGVSGEDLIRLLLDRLLA